MKRSVRSKSIYEDRVKRVKRDHSSKIDRPLLFDTNVLDECTFPREKGKGIIFLKKFHGEERNETERNEKTVIYRRIRITRRPRRVISKYFSCQQGNSVDRTDTPCTNHFSILSV